MERTNPFLSGEGDASVPMTLPASPKNLAFIAEITGSAALLTFLTKLPEYIAAGATVKFQRDNTSIEVGGKKKRDRDVEPEAEFQDDIDKENS